MYLLDSDYLINFLKGKKTTVEVIAKLRRQNKKLYTSIICVGEVLEGFDILKNKEKILIFEKLLETLQILEINRKVINHFALTRGKLRKEGKLIDNFDLLIASTCLAYDLILLTKNIAHFQRIPNLKIYKT